MSSIILNRVWFAWWIRDVISGLWYAVNLHFNSESLGIFLWHPRQIDLSLTLMASVRGTSMRIGYWRSPNPWLFRVGCHGSSCSV